MNIPTKPPVRAEEALPRRRMPPNTPRMRPGRKIDPDHDEYELHMRYWNYSDLTRLVFIVHSDDFKDDWLHTSSLMALEEDPRRTEWFSEQRCHKMYSKMLGKMQSRHIYHKEQSPEEMLMQNVEQMREYQLQGEIDNTQITACQLQSAMEMVDSGEVDRELDFLATAVDNIDEAFEGAYRTWLSRVPPKILPKQQPTIISTHSLSARGKASLMAEDFRRHICPSSHPNYGVRDTTLTASGYSEVRLLYATNS